MGEIWRITLLTEAMVEAPWTMDDPFWERLYHQFPLPDPAKELPSKGEVTGSV